MIPNSFSLGVAVRAGRWVAALPSGSSVVYNRNMAKAIISDKQKRRPPGRPSTGITPLVAFRPPHELVEAIDKWAHGAGVSRSEAMRRLLEQALAKGGKR
ncbi:ribbon-helix-helix domain-containing protein [Reyranella soli]|uniref:Ribbon-helix-helix protein CopG domain-containing protein n=1 Tax=Reyranella soli TaxID=1230389 RepID=A0A512NSJ8_9HYPH|nr:hypothetical protein RSO01_90920 [Reyranella soli]